MAEMKKISIQISNDSETSSVISELNDRIPDSTRNTLEFQALFDQITTCIDDFCQKAKRLAKTGTTIHIEKEFIFSNGNILIVLDYPKKNDLLDKIKGLLKRGEHGSI